MTREEFLNYISQIESNGGRNTNHPVVQHGLNKGYSAIGSYGLMPLTVHDIAKNSTDRDIAALAQEDPRNLKPILEQNPHLEQKVAAEFANKLLAREGDPVKAAYAWNQGSSLRPEQISPEQIAAKDYTQKFQKLAGVLNNAPTQNSTPITPVEPEKAKAEEYNKYLDSLVPEEQESEEQPDEVDQEIEDKSKPKLLALQQFLR